MAWFKRNNNLLKLLLLLFLLLDTCYSFYQFYYTPLDGDMPPVIYPSPTGGYYEVLHDPFGYHAIVTKETYANPNRFFAHWSVSEYFKTIPLALQRIVSPLDSVFLSCALAKICIQLLILYLLAVFISQTKKIFDTGFLMAAVLVVPLFQASGYTGYIGIIDKTVTYNFFYSLPLALLLLFLLPFFELLSGMRNRIPGIPVRILLLTMMIFLSLSGPLIPGIVLIMTALLFLYFIMIKYRQGKDPSTGKIRKFILFYFISFSLLAAYSLYIGQYNYLNTGGTIIPVMERYSRLPQGLLNLFTIKLAFPVLFLMIASNLILIKRFFRTEESRKILVLTGWIIAFAVIYIGLLPLGGYRTYRPFILRYDTAMPVTLAIIFIYGMTSFYILKNSKGTFKIVYSLIIAGIILIYTNADRPETQEYFCQRKALENIAGSNKKMVPLNSDCTVLEWRKNTDYRENILASGLLYYWHITSERKFYYHPPTLLTLPR